MRSLVIVACLGAALALVAPSAARADHGFKKCGDQARPGAGWYEARAYKVPCREAKRVARWVVRHIGKVGKRHRYRVPARGSNMPNWKCRWRRTGYELTFHSCTRKSPRKGHQHVRFLLGA